MQHETWPEYVLRVTAGVSRRDVARAADVNVSGVSRWITGASRPSAEKVVAFARGLRTNPIEALVAAGYLDPSELPGVVEIVRARSALTDDELVAEVAERLARRGESSGDAVVAGDQAQNRVWPSSWLPGGGEDAAVLGDQDRDERRQRRG